MQDQNDVEFYKALLSAVKNSEGGYVGNNRASGKDASQMRPTRFHDSDEAPDRSVGFTGRKRKALHRTRTGDPFLTMPAKKYVKNGGFYRNTNEHKGFWNRVKCRIVYRIGKKGNV